MEPQWSKGISSATVCNTYYFIFVLYALVALVAVVGTLVVLIGIKMPKGLALAYGFQGALTAVLASILMLFQYLVCSRALLGSGKKEGFMNAMEISKLTKKECLAKESTGNVKWRSTSTGGQCVPNII
jgi:hypothetical protein